MTGRTYDRAVKDATADYSDREMHAALDVNVPNYASSIMSTSEIIDSLSSFQRPAIGPPRFA